MKFPKQIYVSKPALVAVAALLLMVGAFPVIWSHRAATPDASGWTNIAFTTTPTPYPLPALVRESPSKLAILIGRVFGRQEPIPDPSMIAADGELLAENEQFDVYVQNGDSHIDPGWWQQASMQVYETVGKRLGATLSAKVTVVFVPPQTRNCAPRGTTFHEQPPVIMIFADETTSKEQILAVLAHELGHVIIHQKYGELRDIALIEGMATWAASDYWLGWKGAGFDSAVRGFINDRTYLPLSQNYSLEKAYDDASPNCIQNRDILLTEWASFVDFLIQNHGIEKLSTLFITKQPETVDGQTIIYPPDFKAVYGLELNQLEHQWLKILLR